MSNNSTVLSDGFNWQYQIVYIVWIVQFIFIGLGNALVAFAIIRYEAIRDRKEYLVIFGLCFADFLNTTAYFIAAVYRTYLLHVGQFYTDRSALYCLFLPQTLLWMFITPIASLMLVVLSIDRLIAVAIPFTYFGFNRHYAYILLSVCYGQSIVIGTIILILGYFRLSGANRIQAPCFTAQIYSPINSLVSLYHLTVPPVYGVLSLIIYTLMAVIYWKKTNVAVADQNQLEQERRFQRRLTKSVTISGLCTFSFMIAPIALANIGEHFDFPRLVMQILWLLPNMNPGCNVVIFLKRQPEIMEALKAMIKCKEMPIDIRLWKANANANANAYQMNAINVA